MSEDRSENDKLKTAIELLSSIAAESGEAVPGPRNTQPTQPLGTQRRGGIYTTTGPNSGIYIVHCSVLGAGLGVTGSCSRALQAIRTIRQRMPCATASAAAAEQRTNFSSYARSTSKTTSWTVKFVCLSGMDARRVPCTVTQREILVQAGLGEKKVVIPDISCSAQDIKGLLITAFPKLEPCGGFELLRCLPNSKELELISFAVSQSPKLLKTVVVGGGRVFIRPIQRDLELDLDQELASSVQVY